MPGFAGGRSTQAASHQATPAARAQITRPDVWPRPPGPGIHSMIMQRRTRTARDVEEGTAGVRSLLLGDPRRGLAAHGPRATRPHSGFCSGAQGESAASSYAREGVLRPAEERVGADVAIDPVLARDRSGPVPPAVPIDVGATDGGAVSDLPVGGAPGAEGDDGVSHGHGGVLPEIDAGGDLAAVCGQRALRQAGLERRKDFPRLPVPPCSRRTRTIGFPERKESVQQIPPPPSS